MQLSGCKVFLPDRLTHSEDYDDGIPNSGCRLFVTLLGPLLLAQLCQGVFQTQLVQTNIKGAFGNPQISGDRG